MTAPGEYDAPSIITFLSSSPPGRTTPAELFPSSFVMTWVSTLIELGLYFAPSIKTPSSPFYSS